MKIFMFFTFLVSMAKSALWICLGILIKDHRDTVLSLIMRKPIPDNIIAEDKLAKVNEVTRLIGIFIIIIGIGVALLGLITLIMSFNMPRHNFNLKF